MKTQLRPELARNLLDKQVTELAWQKSIIELAEEYCGWLVFHDQDSRKNNPGFPDLVMAHHRHGVVYLECKTEDGKVRREQRLWIWTLQQAGEVAAIVRPSDRDWVDRIIRDGPDEEAMDGGMIPPHLRLESPL